MKIYDLLAPFINISMGTLFRTDSQGKKMTFERKNYVRSTGCGHA
jgi:hypothetical protein